MLRCVQILHLPPHHLVPGIAILFAGALVDFEEASLGVEDEYGVAGKIENGTESFLLFLQVAEAAVGVFACFSGHRDPLVDGVPSIENIGRKGQIIAYFIQIQERARRTRWPRQQEGGDSKNRGLPTSNVCAGFAFRADFSAQEHTFSARDRRREEGTGNPSAHPKRTPVVKRRPGEADSSKG
jgi:hypothetical protein